MQFDDVGIPTPESDTSLDENWPTLPSATIDCPTVSEPAPIGTIPQASPNERQRPVRTASRPPRYRDSSFETHFQPVPRRHCRKIQKQNSTIHGDTNVEGYQDLGRGENSENVTPTGIENTTPIASQKTTKTAPAVHNPSEKNARQKQHSVWKPAVIHVSS